MPGGTNTEAQADLIPLSAFAGILTCPAPVTMPQPRCCGILMKTGGKMVMCGGMLSGTTVKSDSCDQYDPVSQTWTSTATMAIARSYLQGTQLNEDDFWLGSK